MARTTATATRREAVRPHPGLSEHVELRITPRTPGAVEVLVMWWEEVGTVAVFLDDEPPVELTSPIDVNQGPERPFLDVLREVLEDAAHGRTPAPRPAWD